MKTTLTVIDRTAASDVDREKLAESLSILPDDPRLEPAARAFFHAMRLQLANKAEATNRTELRRNVESITRALVRIKKTLRHMPEAHYLDEHYLSANNGDPSLMLLRQNYHTESGFELVVDRLLNAVEEFAGDTLESVGKGQPPDTTYTLALINLADFFEQAFPEHPLTHNKRTVFASFAGYWLASISDADPQRHIKTALDLRKAES